ncbi:AtzH-like domain-containing protein [Micromonospora sp. NBC_01796]|uniref:AtzH-like domain-containing protein n=1 Tax=Micromonospora sp. NBC_01796 TaxID=2975987 RepID=UPI002DDA6095|nr:AtzH-like domain-containing protein [Micromonospora sp. NBC_01796]WSA89309.1 nuclear transport factor 2 family protein [Micromonospora sp. NBC_01796]
MGVETGVELAVDRGEVVAEVMAAFLAYEEALVAGDPERIVGYFWDAPQTVRFGIADHQDGFEEQRAWRAAQPPLPPGRWLRGTRVTTFGADFAVVTTLFGYADGDATGRQSQTWVRLPVGWRIVGAHVSEPQSTVVP